MINTRPTTSPSPPPSSVARESMIRLLATNFNGCGCPVSRGFARIDPYKSPLSLVCQGTECARGVMNTPSWSGRASHGSSSLVEPVPRTL